VREARTLPGKAAPAKLTAAGKSRPNLTALWVPNLGSDSISEFTGASLSASGTPAANAVIQSSGGYFNALRTPDAVTFDGSGNLWSTNCHGGPDEQGSVIEFSSAQLRSLHTISSPSPSTVVYNQPASGSLNCPTGLTFDSAGNLWVANNGSSGAAFAHISGWSAEQLSGITNVQPQTLIYGGELADPLGMTFDQAGNLWVADLRAGGNGRLLRYGAGQLTPGANPAPDLIVASASLNQPESLAVDHAGNLWTANCGNATLQMFAVGDLAGTGTVKPHARVTIGAPQADAALGTSALDCKEGLAIDGSGALWVANYYSGHVGSLARFGSEQLTRSGSPTPQVLIDSDQTGTNLNRPFLISIGPAVQ